MKSTQPLSKMVEEVEQLLASKKLPNIETIMNLSKKSYEGAYIDTEIVFIESDSQDLIVHFDGSSQIPIVDKLFHAGELKDYPNFIGQMNKYCHMTNDRISLFAARVKDDYYNNVFALVGIGYFNEKTAQWIARLKLKGHLKWTLLLNGNETPIHYDGLFSKQEKDESIPPEFDDESTEKIKNIIKAAQKQKHGTMLVFLDEDEAKSEAERLCGDFSRGILINRFDIREHLNDIIVPITSIDGALLIDNNGFCYGLGVILDGDASSRANSARGSRYNSALVYVNKMKHENKKCLCIVISEDGMVDPIGTTNIDQIIEKNPDYRMILVDNGYYSMALDYSFGLAEMREAKESLIWGDVDCLGN